MHAEMDAATAEEHTELFQDTVLPSYNINTMPSLSDLEGMAARRLQIPDHVRHACCWALTGPAGCCSCSWLPEHKT